MKLKWILISLFLCSAVGAMAQADQNSTCSADQNLTLQIATCWTQNGLYGLDATWGYPSPRCSHTENTRYVSPGQCDLGQGPMMQNGMYAPCVEGCLTPRCKLYASFCPVETITANNACTCTNGPYFVPETRDLNQVNGYTVQDIR